MEENRIPVSYVAGTSMGGLVGGIYATGRSPAEVKEITNTINWDDVLRGQTPFQDLSFRRKQDAHEVPNSLEFGLRKGLQFPGGFNSGQQVTLILDRVALRIPNSRASTISPYPLPVWLPTLFRVSLMYFAVALCRWHCDRRCLSRASLHLSGRGITSTPMADCSTTFPSTLPKRWGPILSSASIWKPSHSVHRPPFPASPYWVNPSPL